MAATADDQVSALFRAHQAQLARYLRRFVGEEEAEDVLQDVFVSFLKQKREAKIRTQDELAWLYRSCHNRAIDYLRQRKKIIHFTTETFDHLEAREEGQYARAWRALSDELHALAIRFDKKGNGALLLHLLEEGKPKELIAKTLQMSDRQLRRKVALLFQYLQQELHKRGIKELDLQGW